MSREVCFVNATFSCSPRLFRVLPVCAAPAVRPFLRAGFFRSRLSEGPLRLFLHCFLCRLQEIALGIEPLQQKNLGHQCGKHCTCRFNAR